MYVLVYFECRPARSMIFADSVYSKNVTVIAVTVRFHMV